MTFQYQDYRDSKTIRKGEAPGLERRHAHARALKDRDYARQDDRRWPRSWSRFTAWLLRGRPAPSAPAVVVDEHDMTDYVCRLADGSMGRVAILLGTDEEWTAVCVRA